MSSYRRTPQVNRHTVNLDTMILGECTTFFLNGDSFRSSSRASGGGSDYSAKTSHDENSYGALSEKNSIF